MKKLTRRSFACFALFIAGCGAPPADRPTTELHPFSGIINVDGKPSAGAVVALHPEGVSSLGPVTPNGVTDENGMFMLTTYTNADGAPEGKYRVTVSWADVKNTGGGDLEYGHEKLPRRYQDKAASGIEVEVKAGISESPVIQLKSR